MTFNVSIICVDGATCYTLHTDRPEIALNFIKHHDHEGASVTLGVNADDEQAYEVLHALRIVHKLELGPPRNSKVTK